MRNGGVSFWWQQVGLPTPTDRLDGDVTCDVAIVGAGLTGLWTAHYLHEADPTLDIRVVEAEFAGFGASGRNGGWLSSELPGSATAYAGAAGEDGVERMRAAVRATVDEVIDVAAREGIDADIVRSGVLHVARSQAQAERLDGELVGGPGGRADPRGRRRLRALRPRLRPRAPGEAGGRRGPRGAGARRTHPRGHARRLDRAGRRGHRPRHGPRARRAALPRGVHRRAGRAPARVAPDELRDHRDRAADRRASGARSAGAARSCSATRRTPTATPSAPPTAGSRWAGAASPTASARAPTSTAAPRTGRSSRCARPSPRSSRRWPASRSTTPGAASSGVPRDWSASVSFDPATGLGHAGGYVGSGLTATNLAGRTLRDLVLGEDTDLTRLPWTNHRVRRWEPEPLRWAGVHALYRALPGRRPPRGRRPRPHQPHRARRQPGGRALTTLGSGAGHRFALVAPPAAKLERPKRTKTYEQEPT